MELVHRGVWSPEVEALCRGFAALYGLQIGKTVDWKTFLPVQYIESATLPEDARPENNKALQRSLVSQLVSLQKTLRNELQSKRNQRKTGS